MFVQEDNDADVAVAAGLIGFTAGIAIGAAMDNNYYYGPYGWHGGGYMYNDAWDDYYDHREDAREDWIDHREDLVEERSDRLEDRTEQRSDRVENTQEQRTDRQENRQENRPEATQAQRDQAQQRAQQARRHRAPDTERIDTERSDRSAVAPEAPKLAATAVVAGRGVSHATAARTRSRVIRAAHRSVPPALEGSRAAAAAPSRGGGGGRRR